MDDAFTLSAVVFVDYAPIHFSGTVAGDRSSALTMAPGACSDIVRFRALCARILRFLASKGVSTLSDESRLLAPFPVCMSEGDDSSDFADFLERELTQAQRREHIEEMLADLSSAHSAVREVAAQALWRLADRSPESCAAMAAAMKGHRDDIAKAVTRDVAESWPIAAAMRLAVATLPIRGEGALLAWCATPVSGVSTSWCLWRLELEEEEDHMFSEPWEVILP